LEQSINYLCLPQPRLQIAVYFLGIRATKTNPVVGLVLIPWRAEPKTAALKSDYARVFGLPPSRDAVLIFKEVRSSAIRC
jgi:hypothetical protein